MSIGPSILIIIFVNSSRRQPRRKKRRRKHRAKPQKRKGRTGELRRGSIQYHTRYTYSKCIAVVFFSSAVGTRKFRVNNAIVRTECVQESAGPKCDIRWTSKNNQNINPSQHYGEHECQTTEWTKKTRIFTKQDVTSSKHRCTQLLLLLLAITVHAVHLASCIGASSYVCMSLCDGITRCVRDYDVISIHDIFRASSPPSSCIEINEAHDMYFASDSVHRTERQNSISECLCNENQITHKHRDREIEIQKWMNETNMQLNTWIMRDQCSLLGMYSLVLNAYYYSSCPATWQRRRR